MTTAELLKQVHNLSREEKLDLARELWLEADGKHADEAEIAAAWDAEIVSRVKQIVDGTATLLTDDEMLERLAQ